MMLHRLLGALTAVAICACAQPPYLSRITPTADQQAISFNRGSAALWQSLKKLHTRASLVWLAAHPDDEDGSALAYESRALGTRTVLSQTNRGEGGANVVSNDYFDLLGLVRTMELLQAGEYYGVEQRWTTMVDYGFSKTLDETFKNWTHDRYFYDIVRIIRMERPLIVVTSHPDGAAAGHGNHQATGRVAVEVMKAAGDPNVFPDQIKAGLRPWTPLKGYVRGGRGAGPPPNVQLPVGAYDPLLGANYLQIGREGLSFQKSQNGGGSIPNPGEANAAYRRFASVVQANDKEEGFFDGIDVSLLGIASLAKGGDAGFLNTGLRNITSAVDDAIAKFSATQPERTATSLATGLRETIKLLDAVDRSNLAADSKADIRHELEIKRAQFNNALAEALGLSVNAAVAPPEEPGGRGGMMFGDPETSRTAIPGQTLTVSVQAVNQSSAPVKLQKLTLETDGQRQPWTITAPLTPLSGDLAANKPVQARFTVKVPDNAEFTRPYFSRPDIEQSWYDVTDERFRYESFAPYPLAAWLEASYDGVPIRIGQYVQTTKRVNGKGTVYEPLVVAPAISVAIAPRMGIVPLGSKSFSVSAAIHSNVKGPANGTIRLELPAGWQSEPASAPFATAADGQEQSATFRVTPANIGVEAYKITAVAEYSGKQYREGYETTSDTDIRPYFLYRPSVLKTTGVDVKVVSGLKIAYVAGSGDDVPAALEPLGIQVTFLAANDIATGDLSKYDCILLGVRAYAARDDLRTHNGRLLEYVKNGGVVVVQYNTPEYDHNYGPYPYVMGRNPEEVTDEASKVEILNPAHPLLNWPNKITAKDFEGWVEERGSKWMESWDPQYEALLETHDEGQPPQKGGLLYAKYGKGVYIYNAYAFYRQLPEGVPGAYRIFANMLSMAKNPQR